MCVCMYVYMFFNSVYFSVSIAHLLDLSVLYWICNLVNITVWTMMMLYICFPVQFYTSTKISKEGNSFSPKIELELHTRWEFIPLGYFCLCLKCLAALSLLYYSVYLTGEFVFKQCLKDRQSMFTSRAQTWSLLIAVSFGGSRSRPLSQTQFGDSKTFKLNAPRFSPPEGVKVPLLSFSLWSPTKR